MNSNRYNGPINFSCKAKGKVIAATMIARIIRLIKFNPNTGQNFLIPTSKVSLKLLFFPASTLADPFTKAPCEVITSQTVKIESNTIIKNIAIIIPK